MASIINTGVSALNAFKRQMETTGHNIANVNTPGFSRQTVQFSAREPEIAPQGVVGSGVAVTSIRRSYDEFLATRARDYGAMYTEFSIYEQRARQVDDIMADATSGIDDILQKFFASVNDVADDPTSVAARTVMLNRANQLTDRFNGLDSWLANLRGQINRDLQTEVDDINSLAESLAGINARITALGNADRVPPNDMLDERDRLIDELSKYTSVSSVHQSDGAISVFVGTGQALVVGATFNRLSSGANAYDPSRQELFLQQLGNPPVNVTAQMTGGSLGGMLRFREEVLDASQDALGRIAIGMATFFNDEHRTGLDMDGEIGRAFFALSAPVALGHAGNSPGSSVTIGITDPAALSTHGYRLDLTGAVWSMTDLDTGASVVLSGAGSAGDPLVASPDLGFNVVVGSAASGDSFVLRPTRSGAAGIRVLVTDERDIAAADPLRISAAAGNGGTGRIEQGGLISRVDSPTLPTLPAISIVYQTAGDQLQISGGPAGTQFLQADGTPLGASAAFVAGQSYRVSVPTLGTFQFTMTGGPANGDSFTLQDNAGGIGDNRNARALADLQTANVMLGGTATLANTYGSLVADIGAKTQQAANNAGVHKSLLSQAEAAKAEVSGVNLDEEAANLVRFQQAYQAAAQVISVANSLFDSLLGAVRR